MPMIAEGKVHTENTTHSASSPTFYSKVEDRVLFVSNPTHFFKFNVVYDDWDPKCQKTLCLAVC